MSNEATPHAIGEKELAARLNKYVTDIFKAFETKTKHNNEIEGVRAQLISTLSLTAGLLGEVKKGEKSTAFEAIRTLAGALLDLRHGITNPLLEPTSFELRAPDRTDVWMVRSRAAIGIQFLIEAKMARKDAAKLAEKNFPDLSRALRSGANPQVPLRDSLLRWRYDLKSNKKRNKLAKVYFETGMYDLNQIKGVWSADTIKRAGINILTTAEEWARRLPA